MKSETIRALGCAIITSALVGAVASTHAQAQSLQVPIPKSAAEVSGPVSGTLMVEPTESETKAEIDRFITALLTIRDEIKAIEAGTITAEDSPLRHAPHTVEDLVADWTRAYTREQGCFPPGSFRVDKYWPPVGRVDNVWGDRNLTCSCPPMEHYSDAGD